MSIQYRSHTIEDFDFADQVNFEEAEARRDFVSPFDFRGYITTLLLSSWAATAVVASHSWAYVVDPRAAGVSPLRSAELYVFWAAWILLCVGPMIAVIWSQYRDVWSWFIPTIAIAWPVTLLAIHATLNYEFGNWYFGYLQENPMMYVTDVVIPATLLIVHFRVRRQCATLNS